MSRTQHTPSRLVVFRANGGPGVGNGHIIRCVALAQELSKLGWSTMLAASEVTFSTMPQASKFDRMIYLDANMDEIKRLTEVVEGKADLLVIDDYAQNIQFEESCRKWTHKILVIDDLANQHHDADYIVNSGPQSSASYDPLVPQHCQRLLGPKWALLRPEFSVRRKTALLRRRLDAPVQRILIAVGGADGRNLTPSLLSAAIAATAGLHVNLDVILGGHASSLPTVREMQRQKPTSFDLHVDTDEVAFLMSSADVAIGACGVGGWERCTMGLPTIGIVTAENQKSIAAALREAGAIDLIGEWSETTEAGIKAAITSLLNDPHRRQTMSTAASELCDGGGIFRLGAVLDGTETNQALHDW